MPETKSPEEQAPASPPPDLPKEPTSVEERLERDLNLEPRTREAQTPQINESFTAPDSLARDDRTKPQVDFSGIEKLAHETFFIAEGVGKPQFVQVDSRTFSIIYPYDDSIVTVRIECRPGKFHGVSNLKPFTDQQKKQANDHFNKRREQWESILKNQRERNAELAGGAPAKGSATQKEPVTIPESETPRAKAAKEKEQQHEDNKRHAVHGK